MFPVGTVHDESEAVRPLPRGQATGRGLLRKSDVGCTQKKGYVQDPRVMSRLELN